MSGYQKLEPPKPEEAVVVGINIEILDILGVNDKVSGGSGGEKVAKVTWMELEKVTQAEIIFV
jgi:hypothetical protein